MKLKDILKTVGSGLISTLVPGGPAIVGMLNGVLSDDNKLPENATGTQAQNAIETLSASDKANVLNKQYDVEIEEIRGFTDRFKAMADVDSTGHTTRPQIAMMMAINVSFTIFLTVALFCHAIYKSDEEMIKAIISGWPFLVAILGIPSALLRAYFAMRTKEKQHKYHASTGTAPQGNLMSAVVGMFKK